MRPWCRFDDSKRSHCLKLTTAAPKEVSIDAATAWRPLYQSLFSLKEEQGTALNDSLGGKQRSKSALPDAPTVDKTVYSL